MHCVGTDNSWPRPILRLGPRPKPRRAVAKDTLRKSKKSTRAWPKTILCSAPHKTPGERGAKSVQGQGKGKIRQDSNTESCI